MGMLFLCDILGTTPFFNKFFQFLPKKPRKIAEKLALKTSSFGFFVT